MGTLLLRSVPGEAAGPALDLLASSGASREWLAEMVTDGCVLALVDAADDIEVPLAAALVQRPDASGVAEVCALAVDPAYRRRGLDQRVLAESVDVLRALGASVVRARLPGWDVAAELFEAAGFHEVQADPATGQCDVGGGAIDCAWFELDL